jgi:hypothetical protein
MEYIGGENLFTSHFVMGCLLPTDKNLEVVSFLNDWMHYKDSDWGMSKYKTARTQYISFLHIIEIPVLKDIIIDLSKYYKKQFPYSEQKDFLDYTFDYTLHDLKRLLEKDSFTWLASAPTKNNFHVYYKYESDSFEFLDFIVDKDKTINYYKQYFKKVLELFDSFDYENLSFESKKEMYNEKTEKPKDIKKEYWFIVGLKFATGKIQELNKKGFSAPKIASELFNEYKVTSIRPYITDSIGNSTTRSQNIYSNNDHLLIIYNHCKENSITVVEEFKSRIQFD